MPTETDRISKVETLLNQGAIFHAHNLAQTLIDEGTSTPRVLQLLASSLTKLGQPEKAIEVLSVLHATNPQDSESSGILGRAYKDLFRKSGDKKHLLKSRDIYLNNYLSSGSYYTGINAATLSFLLKDDSRAAILANEVLEKVGTGSDFWSLATKGEAYLLLHQFKEALHQYRDALRIAGANWGQINSSRQQLSFIAEYRTIPSEFFELIQKPGIAVFTGHMIDSIDRIIPRFPESEISTVKEQLRRTILEDNISIGFSSIASGADILFIETMLELGREVKLFLPFNEKDFRKTSLRIGNENWEKRFDQIIESNEVDFVTEERYLDTDELFHFLGKVMMGQAMLHADIYETEPTLLSVLSESQAKKTGGTQDLVNMWPDKSKWTNIKPLADPPTDAAGPSTVQNTGNRDSVSREIRYILFSDIVGFSKLNEDETPQFIHEVLSSIAILAKGQSFAPEVINTWGDAIFVGHSNASELVEFAFELLNLFESTDWSKMGFPVSTNIRIALHAGPVFISEDPLTKRPNLYGSHVNKAARMEPVTIPGTVFASDQFASCLRIENASYEYEHVGMIDLPKKFGRQEIYRLSSKKA